MGSWIVRDRRQIQELPTLYYSHSHPDNRSICFLVAVSAVFKYASQRLDASPYTGAQVLLFWNPQEDYAQKGLKGVRSHFCQRRCHTFEAFE